MKDNTLLLIKDFSELQTEKNYLSVLPLSKDIKDKFKIKEVSFNTPSRSELLKNYNYCNDLFKILFKKIIEILNRIHKINFNEREWNIIIGYWLQNYIYSSYKIYNQLKFTFENEKINNIFASDFRNYDFATKNTKEFAETPHQDLNWYYCFYSKILDYFQNNFNKEIIFKKINYHKYQEKEKKSKSIKKTINFFLRKFKKSDSAFISHTYLPFLEEKKLELLFKQIPFYYYEDINSHDDKQTDSSLRKKYFNFIKKEEISFENYLISNICNFIPKSFLENFENNLKLAKTNIFPQDTKFIFTSSLNFFDEIFKIYAALQVKNKKPLFIGQHGNNYFTRIHNNFMPELDYSTKFFSWGFNSPKYKKVTGLFNFKTINFKVKRVEHSKKKLIIFLDHLSTTPYNLLYCPDENIKSLIRLKTFLSTLKKEILENVILRLNETIYKKIYGFNYLNFILDNKVEIDSGKKRTKKLLEKAKLCLFNYDSTGFLENYCNNMF